MPSYKTHFDEYRDKADNLHDSLSLYYNHNVLPTALRLGAERYSHDSKNINRHLVDLHVNGSSNPAKSTQSALDQLDRGFARLKQKVPYDIDTFSGTTNYNPSEHFKKHGKIYTPSFISTSINPIIAHAYTHQWEGGHDYDPNNNTRHLLHFHLPEGYKNGVYIGHVSAIPAEREFLLNRGQAWKLKSHHVVNDDDPRNPNIHVWHVTPDD
jgi:hypothetical protein